MGVLLCRAANCRSGPVASREAGAGKLACRSLGDKGLLVRVCESIVPRATESQKASRVKL